MIHPACRISQRALVNQALQTPPCFIYPEMVDQSISIGRASLVCCLASYSSLAGYTTTCIQIVLDKKNSIN